MVIILSNHLEDSSAPYFMVLKLGMKNNGAIKIEIDYPKSKRK